MKLLSGWLLRPRRRTVRPRWTPQFLALEDRLTPATLAPDQVRHAYGIDSIPLFNGTTKADGTGITIAIVDAFDDPNIASDLAFFDTTYGTTANQLNARSVSSFFTKVNQTGGTSYPSASASWAGEIALDVEWAHTIAPMANIILVEATSNSTPNFGIADQWAAAHAQVVSNSWGGGEYSGETTDDTTYLSNPSSTGSPGVAFLFSSGDSGDISYPSSSRNALSVGATNLTVNGSNNYVGETGWSYSGGSGGGGGTSTVEPRPAYQNGVSAVVGTHRGTPDVSMMGGSGSPVSVYNTYPSGGFSAVWGTSASCPMWAGVVALIDQGRSLATGPNSAPLQPLNSPLESGSTNLYSYQLQTNLYALATANPGDFHDVTSGTNFYGQTAAAGYDLVTGLGSPVANLLVADMVGYTTTTAAVSTPSPTAFGAITLTATVGGKSVGRTGTVDFKYGLIDLGTVPLSGNVATLTLASSPLPAGSDLITAVYSGDTNYAASTGTVTATVGQAGSGTSVTGSPLTIAVGQSTTITATVSGVSGHTPTGSVDFKFGSTDLGTVTLTNGVASLPTSALPIGASDTVTAIYLGDTNYGTSSGTVNIAVTGVLLTVTTDPEAMTYGGAFPTLTYTVSGLVGTDTAAQVLTGAIATTATPTSGYLAAGYPITQGTLALTGVSSSGTVYSLNFVPGTLTINKAPLTVTANPAAKVYGAALPALTIQTPVGLVNGDGPSVVTGLPDTTATASSPVLAGGYPITQGALAAANYTITFVGGTLTVTPAPLTITADNKGMTYGGALPALTATFAGLVNGDTPAAVTGLSLATTPAISHAGSYPITASGATDPNYDTTLVNGTLTINKAALTITADNKGMTYGGALPGLTASFAGLVNGDTPAAVTGLSLGTVPATSHVGSYPITASGAADPDYTISFQPGTLTINKAALTISADNKGMTYGGALPALTASFAGLVNGDTSAAVTGLSLGTVPATSHVGSYPITASGAADPDYTVSFQPGTLTINKAALTITADNKGMTYGGGLPALTVSFAGLVNGDTPAVVTGLSLATVPATSHAGSYPITAAGAAETDYNIAYQPGSLTINKATLTVAAKPQSMAYGGAYPALTFTVSGLVNGDSAAVVGGSLASAPATSGVGTYPISRGTLAAADYTVGFTGSTLTVNKAPLAVAANPAKMVYGAAVPALTFTAAGLVNGDTAAALTGGLATPATPASGVGTYPVTQGTLAAANYAISFTGSALTVTPAPLFVTADDKEGLAAVSIPTLTYTVTGLVNGDSPAVVTGVGVTTTATLTSPEGTYPITVSGGKAANYTVVTVNGPSGGVLTLASSFNLIGSTDFATGTGAGGPPVATLYRPGGDIQFSQAAFDPSFAGGVRVAVADFNGDGTPDLVVGTGPGVPTLVRVIDGASGLEMYRVQPFEPAFTGGVYVTTGELGPSGKPELIVTPDEGGGPRVEVFDLSAAGPTLVANFFGIDDPNFRGGARAAVGDLNGDGHADLIVAAGFGGGPRVSAYDGTTVASGQPVLMFNVFVFEQTLRNGVFVTAGDVNGDGKADLVVGGGPGGGPRVEAFSGADLAKGAADPTVLANFFAGNLDNRGGVRVVAKNLDGDRLADLVIGDGDGAGSRVSVYSGKSLASDNPTADLSFDAAPGFTGGVYVG
jgi:hypothetical protein